MKITKVIIDSENNILGLGDDNKMYIWNEYTAIWDLLLVKTN